MSGNKTEDQNPENPDATSRGGDSDEPNYE
jgi:hypothetical protein